MELKDKDVRELEDILIRTRSQHDRIESSLSELKRERQAKINEITQLTNLISKKKKPNANNEPKVSAHAMLRYVERILGVDIAELEAQILTAGNVAAIEAGAVRITSNGITFVIRDKIVVTVLD